MRCSALEEVVLRSMKDEAFLDRLIVNPEKTLNDMDLTKEEFQAIATGDENCLNELLGFGGNTANVNSNKYQHSQHKGLAGQKPDLLPRVVTK